MALRQRLGEADAEVRAARAAGRVQQRALDQRIDGLEPLSGRRDPAEAHLEHPPSVHQARVEAARVVDAVDVDGEHQRRVVGGEVHAAHPRRSPGDARQREQRARHEVQQAEHGRSVGQDAGEVKKPFGFE
ncbi:MAG: hypothetical protein H6704_15115 [Myxococcales bacterium]|nr:hypothetical protein [Myxococcales bacterium]